MCNPTDAGLARSYVRLNAFAREGRRQGGSRSLGRVSLARGGEMGAVMTLGGAPDGVRTSCSVFGEIASCLRVGAAFDRLADRGEGGVKLLQPAVKEISARCFGLWPRERVREHS